MQSLLPPSTKKVGSVSPAFAWVAICLMPASAYGCDGGSGSAWQQRTHTEAVIARIDPSALVRNSVSVSPAANHVAYVEEVGSRGKRVVVDMEAHESFRDVGMIPQMESGLKPRFSFDGQRVAYAAHTGERMVAVIDGEVDRPSQSPFDLIYPDFVFSSDGARVAYTASKDDRWFVVVDGQVYADHPKLNGQLFGVPAGDLVFSPDGSRLAYRALVGARAFVILDHDTIGTHATLRSRPREGLGTGMAFSPDGSRFAYIAKEDDATTVFVDDSIRWRHDGVSTVPVFGAVGDRIAYDAVDNGRGTLVVNGEALMQYDDSYRGTPQFSPDGLRVAVAVRDGDRSYLIVDEVWSDGFEALAVGTVFGPKSQRVTFFGERDGEWVLVTDDRQTRLDGVPVGSSLVYSPDGQLTAHVERRDDQYVAVVNGHAGPPYPGIVTDGSGIVFVSDTTIRYLAIRGTELLRVTESIN